MPDPSADPIGQYWADGIGGNTPLNAENLNGRELAIHAEAIQVAATNAAPNALRGETDRYYDIVSSFMTFDGTQWVLRNDATSRPTNIDSVETDTSKITLHHESVLARKAVGQPAVTPGENLRSVGIEGIARLSSDFKTTAIVLRQTRTLEDSASNPGNGNAWDLEKGSASPFTVSGLTGLSTNFATVAAGLGGGPVGHLRFDETSGAVIQDATANNRDGAVVSTGTTYDITGPLTHESDNAMQVATGGTNEFTVDWSSFMGSATYSVVWLGKIPVGGTVAWRDASTTTGAGHFVSKDGNGKIMHRWGNNTTNTFATTTDWSTIENQWVMFVAVKNGTADTVALYLATASGVTLLDSRTGITTDVAINGAWHLGRSGQGGSAVASQAVTMSEFIGYNAALSAADVSALQYAAFSDGLLHVTHADMHNTLKSGIKLTAQGSLRPVLLPASVTATGFNIAFYDDAGAQVLVADTDMAIGISRSASNQIVDPTNLSVDVVVQKEDSWANTVASLLPDGWLRLGESSGTSYNDEIGTNDGTSQATVTNGATGAVVGDANTAVTLDGTQGKIGLANPVLTSQFSLGIIAKPTGTSNVGGTTYGCMIGASASGTRRVMVNPTTGQLYVELGGTIFISGNGLIPLNQYSFVVVTWDGTTMRSYVNGILVGTTITANVNLNQAFFLGSYATTSTNYSFEGSLDEFFWAKRAWSVNEIQQLQVTWTDTVLKTDRSTQASLSFYANFETDAPPVEPEPDSPVPDPNSLPTGDVGGAVAANIPLTAYRTQLNADTIESSWVGRALPDTQGARDAIELNGLPGFANATSANWVSWFNGAFVGPGHTLGGGTPLYMNVARHPIYVVDNNQPRRSLTDQDATVSGWASTINSTQSSLGGMPLPYDAFPDFTGDRYTFVYNIDSHEIWAIYSHNPVVGSSEAATTTLEYSGSPSSGGFFLEFDYLDPLNRNTQTFTSQGSVPFDVTADGLKTILNASKNAAGTVFANGGVRSNLIAVTVTGGPLHQAPITIQWNAGFPGRSVAMRVKDNFMNSGHVLFDYKNSDSWGGSRLASITHPSIANASHHVVAKGTGGPTQGGSAYATGLEALALHMDWWEYKVAYDAGINAGDGTIAGADWDAPGTDMGHVLSLMVGNCAQGAVYPALRGDGTIVSADRSILMQGALMTFRLDSTPPNPITYHFLMPLYNTCKRYGFMPIDKTGGGCEFIWRYWGWPGQTVPFPGPPGFQLNSQSYPVYMNQLPWSQMQIIDPADVQAGW